MSLRIQDTARNITISGTTIQFLEIYTGEKYIYPVQFRNAMNQPTDITGWTFDTSVKYYTATYSGTDPTPPNPVTPYQVTVTNLAVFTPETYGNTTVTVVDPATGSITLTVPTDITPNNYVFPVESNPVLLAVVSMNVTRTDTTISREPLGFIIRNI